MKKVPILRVFGEGGVPDILLVVSEGVEGWEGLPKRYRKYKTFYCLPARSVDLLSGFRLEVIHIPSGEILYLDEKTMVLM